MNRCKNPTKQFLVIYINGATIVCSKGDEVLSWKEMEWHREMCFLLRHTHGIEFNLKEVLMKGIMCDFKQIIAFEIK